MGRFPWAASVVVTFILMGGCSTPFSNDEPVSLPDAESPASQPPEPIASLPPQPNPILIPPTDPDQRLRTLKGGRADPFKTLVSATGPSDTNSGLSGTGSGASNTGSKAKLGGTSSGVGQISTHSIARLSGTGSGVVATTRSATSGSLCGAPRSASSIALGASLAIKISGIVSMGGIARAVIKAPNERVSQTVRVGERLSSGTLVKAIYPNRAKPVVILEQNGFEVSRGVGEVPPSPQKNLAVTIPRTAGAFGLVRGLALNSVNVSEAVSSSKPLVTGVICNNTNKVIRVAQITLQLEDNRNGTVINSFPVIFAAPYILKPGQKAEFDERLQNTELGLRGRDKSQTVTKLGGWS